MLHPVFAKNITVEGGNSTDTTFGTTDTTFDTTDTFFTSPYFAKSWPQAQTQEECKTYLSNFLNSSTEYDKAGYSVGTTIMALLPSLLSFAPIVTARIGLLSSLSRSHGVIAAAFTFGLPVEQLEVITTQSVTSVKRLLGGLLGVVQDVVLAAGEAGSPTDPPEPPIPADSTPTDVLPTLANFDSPEIVHTQHRVNQCTSCHNDPRSFSGIAEDALSSIRKTAFGCNRLSIWRVQAAMFLLTFFHFGLACCLFFVILLLDPSILLWDCPDTTFLTTFLLMGVFCLVGPLRMIFERKRFTSTDIIHISKATNTMGTTYWSRLRDPHPMIVILRPSPNATFDLNGQDSKGARDIRAVCLIGMFQLCWILFLSFFFSSLIGGTPFSSLTSVCIFVVVVAISRALSILTIWLVEKDIGLQVIEFDDPLELAVMQVLIGALPEARVEVRGKRNSSWEKCYLQGQSMGYGLDFKTSTIFVSAREAIPMLSVLTIFAVGYYEFFGGGFINSLPFVSFGIACLARRREKCIVLRNRNREAGTDQV